MSIISHIFCFRFESLYEKNNSSSLFFVFQLRAEEAAFRSSAASGPKLISSKVNGKTRPSTAHTTNSTDKPQVSKKATVSCPNVHSSKNLKSPIPKKNAHVCVEINKDQVTHQQRKINGILSAGDISLKVDKKTATLAISTEERGQSWDKFCHKQKLAMSSADAFRLAGLAAKTEGKTVTQPKNYYQKAMVLVGVGGTIFATGIVFAILHFSEKFTNVQMMGPVCLAIGLLMVICGVVWLPIIKTKLKRQERSSNQTL